MTSPNTLNELRNHRSLLLAMEAIGWLHMTGKANVGFLEDKGHIKNSYQEKSWYKSLKQPDPSKPSEYISWPIQDIFDWLDGSIQCFHTITKFPGTPPTLENIVKSMFNDYDGGQSKQNLIGFLQAGHAMASGIEKNVNSDTAKYLAQDATHMWLSSPLGQSKRNLLANPPIVLALEGWDDLLKKIEKLLANLKERGETPDDLEKWWDWREGAIGSDGWLRKTYTSTVAETRLPNNDVTLFDQSYVAAALFKSALAGAIIEGPAFDWNSDDLKSNTKWRLLTVGIGADHYEARAVKIGDWTGAKLKLDEFFKEVRRLVEVDFAVGSLLYQDASVCVFSFPAVNDDRKSMQEEILEQMMDGYAKEMNLETPPYCFISDPSRSLVGMAAEIKKAKETMTVPLHRSWDIKNAGQENKNVCPVCLVRRNNGSKIDPCPICQERRTGRQKKWLETTKQEAQPKDTIWISELADANDRVAMLTFSLDIEPWLDGTRMDSLRTQAIDEWRKHNEKPRKHLESKISLCDSSKKPFDEILCYMQDTVKKGFNQGDQILNALLPNEALQKYVNLPSQEKWPTFFRDIVKDRVVSDQPEWEPKNLPQNTAWLTHQLFRKLPSPGRIYRFEREAEEFFVELLVKFRETASKNANRWRTRRLVLKDEKDTPPANGKTHKRQTYNGQLNGKPVSLLCRENSHDYLTICNLARLLKPEDGMDELKGKTLSLKGEDDTQPLSLTIKNLSEDEQGLGVYNPIIPLECSPVRFRVLVPLDAVDECVEQASAMWADRFGRVWDRMPLNVGIAAFPRMMPFQAVVEAARSIEDALTPAETPEMWRVESCESRDGVASLALRPNDGTAPELRSVLVRLPDGREDVFYPYLTVEDRETRFPLDFKHPDGRVFRHAKDLRHGDGVAVCPSRVAFLFLDSAGKRFEPVAPMRLAEWDRMRDLWKLLERVAPSQTALRGAWSLLLEKRAAWEDSWLEGGETAWLGLVRAVFADRLEAEGAALDALVRAASDGLLGKCLEWNVNVLKKQVSEVK